jgi:hypothetical protein
METVFNSDTTAITVARAVNMLSYVMKSRGDRVMFADKKIYVFELGEHPELTNLPADRVKLIFCGGPPGAYNTYKGSLLSLLIDRIMWEEIHGSVTMVNNLETILRRRIDIHYPNWMELDDTEALTSGPLSSPPV